MLVIFVWFYKYKKRDIRYNLKNRGAGFGIATLFWWREVGGDNMRKRLIKKFTENYMKKTLYFRSKKTSDHYEAEDLSQDIALRIIISLQSGTIPTTFGFWISSPSRVREGWEGIERRAGFLD